VICWCFGLQCSTFFTSDQGLLDMFFAEFLSFILTDQKGRGIYIILHTKGAHTHKDSQKSLEKANFGYDFHFRGRGEL
jgi:hypothetical protein